MGRRRGRRWFRWLGAALSAGLISACAALLLVGTTSTVEGRAVSMLYDPWRVGGLPLTDGASGSRPDAPAATGTVRDTDGGDVDRLALLAIDDIVDYWQHGYPAFAGFAGSFAPVSTLISYDSNRPDSVLCGVDTHRFVNAFYCYGQDMMAWDRGVLLPGAKRYFGDMAVAAVLAHEYGHAVQDMAKLIDSSTPTLVAEQQADCFTGAYLRWVAEGSSRRFTLSTTDGLNGVLAGLVALRDPVPGPDGELVVGAGHGTALDRLGAFQLGFDAGVTRCTEIDTGDIQDRRTGTPVTLRVGPTAQRHNTDVVIDKNMVSRLVEVLDAGFRPERPATVSFGAAPCPDGEASPPVSYCPASNIISVDLSGLQRMAGVGRDAGAERFMLHGTNTALSVVMSRYMLALQHDRGLELTSAQAGLRTACLTGLGQRMLSEPAPGRGWTFNADDLDEAVTGLLTNGLVASGVDGAAVPAGFTRILAFRSGLLGDAELCYQRFGAPPG